MLVQTQSADPVIHDKAVRIARECVNVVSAILRPEEVQECLKEYYVIARAILEEPCTTSPKP